MTTRTPPKKGYVSKGARVSSKMKTTRPRPAAQADWTDRRGRLHDGATGRFKSKIPTEVFSLSPSCRSDEDENDYFPELENLDICLLYTSDAADE